MKAYAAIDIGGTAIKYGLIAEDGTLLEKDKMPTEGWKGGPSILKKVLGIVERYQNQVAGVCISTAGMVDIEKGEIFYAGPTIPDFKGTKFREAIQNQFGLPCEVENDVNCAGLAEAKFGAGKDASSVLCLTVGTGIGGCFVLNGEVFHGFSGSACEIGYMKIDSSNKNFQELGATSVLTDYIRRVKYRKAKDAERAAKREAEEAGVAYVPVKTRTEHWSGKRVFEAAKEGDEDCIRGIERMCNSLGIGISNICMVLNPEVVVLGGGVMAQQEYLYPRIKASIDRNLVVSIAEKTKLKFAEFQNSAGMVGAFYHYQWMRSRRIARGETVLPEK